MRNVEIDEQFVRDVEIGRDISWLHERGVEVDRDGDAAQLLFQRVPDISILHVEDTRSVRMKDIVLVDPEGICGEGDPGHVQAIKLMWDK